MTNGSKRGRLLLAALLAGSVLFNVGNCTTQEIKVQVSNGLASTLTGIFNVASTDLADEVLDVDD